METLALDTFVVSTRYANCSGFIVGFSGSTDVEVTHYQIRNLEGRYVWLCKREVAVADPYAGL